MDVAIIGGGIAGLALAIGLNRHGIIPTIYEAAPEIREIGVGITLLPHAVRELATLGLQDEVAAAGIENKTSGFYNRFGQRLYSEPRGRFAGYDHPEIGIHRGRLHGILYAAAIARLGTDRILTGRQCLGLEQDRAGVDLYFKDSLGARADVVIACDGVNSAVRRHFYPDDAIAFTGINTWRGVTRRKPILDGRTYMRVGALKTGKMVIYPIADFDDGTQLINWVAELEREGSTANDWNKGGRKQDVLPIFDSFRFDWLDIPELIDNAETVLEYPMVDKDPIDRWTFGRVTLAGDAAHPMYPRGSNGSAQALIDARTIADLLAGGESLAALRAYESMRGPVTANIVRTNRSSPPDIINIKVEELVGDQPFDNLDDYITQDELRALSDRYKQVAGFAPPAAMA
jgi:5-methylphenazine-1-carboxylate 1-monooxygenase